MSSQARPFHSFCSAEGASSLCGCGCRLLRPHRHHPHIGPCISAQWSFSACESVGRAHGPIDAVLSSAGVGTLLAVIVRTSTPVFQQLFVCSGDSTWTEMAFERYWGSHTAGKTCQPRKPDEQYLARGVGKDRTAAAAAPVRANGTTTLCPGTHVSPRSELNGTGIISVKSSDAASSAGLFSREI